MIKDFYLESRNIQTPNSALIQRTDWLRIETNTKRKRHKLKNEKTERCLAAKNGITYKKASENSSHNFCSNSNSVIKQAISKTKGKTIIVCP